VTNYQHELWRRITHSNALRLDQAGKPAEAKREYRRLWADAHGVADSDRDGGR
jgi:hypothetical protein